MAEQPDVPDDAAFDIQKIRQLVRLMRDYDLSEVDLRWDTSRVRLRRGGDEAAPPVVHSVHDRPPVAAPVAAGEGSSPSDAVEAATEPTIDSPVVGTFYAASSPDAEPFVTVGSRVSATTVICIVEAMKVFNEIPAGVSGTVREVLVENGAAVEYGQPLFRYSAD